MLPKPPTNPLPICQ